MDHGYETVTIHDLVRYVDGLGDLPEKPVMLTFDDGHYNNYLYAYPLLKERGMKAVVSVIGKETEQYTESGQENAYWSYLNMDRLCEISADGTFEIQNHSYDLHENDARKGALRMRGESLESYRMMLVEDTERTQKLLIEGGVPTPVCYTYPYGACSRESEEVIKSLGFMCTMGCESVPTPCGGMTRTAFTGWGGITARRASAQKNFLGRCWRNKEALHGHKLPHRRSAVPKKSLTCATDAGWAMSGMWKSTWYAGG